MENKNNEEQQGNLEKHPKQDFQVERLAFFSEPTTTAPTPKLLTSIRKKNPKNRKNSIL